MKALLKEYLRITGTITKKHTGTHASSIAFFFFMALVPLLIIYACLIPKGGTGSGEIISLLQNLVPKELNGLIQTVVTEAFSKSQIAFSVSLLFVIWTASRGIRSLIDGLNAMYDETEMRSFANITGVSVLYTIVLVLFLSGAVFLIFSGRFLRILKKIVPSVTLPGPTMTFITFLGMFFSGIMVFELIYTFLPSGSRKFRDQFPGAFLASSGWFILSIGFRIYVGYFNGITRLYGSLATVSLFLFWLYCVFYILLAGGCVNRNFAQLVPECIYVFFRHDRRAGTLVWILFLTGFTAYLSNCFLSWKLNAEGTLRLMQFIFKMVTQACWIASTVICIRSFPEDHLLKPVIPLFFMAAFDIILLRPAFFKNIFLYLAVYTFFCLAELLMCLYVVLMEAE